MKQILTLTILLFTATVAFSQEKFRVDYDYVAVVLDAHIFENFSSLKNTVDEFIENYNNEYHHQSLNGKCPKEYLNKSKKQLTLACLK